MENLKKIYSILYTFPEIRIQFFSDLTKLVDLTSVITDLKLATTVYQFNSSIPETF